MKCFNEPREPWGYFLAGGPTPKFAEVQAHHGPAINAADADLRAAYRALLLDLMHRIWGVAPDRSVPREALREHGFDPDTPEPNFDLYW